MCPREQRERDRRGVEKREERVADSLVLNRRMDRDRERKGPASHSQRNGTQRQREKGASLTLTEK